MDCFHDFCLNCDRESTSGPYCSQSCRLADLEKAGSPPSPTSPTAPSRATQNQQSSWALSGQTGRSAYVLAPAYKFPERARGYNRRNTNEDTRPRASYFMRSTPTSSNNGSQSRERSLTPSSSRSSLSSTTGSSNPTTLSQQAKQELQGYFNAFDHARASKRRQSTW